MKEIFELQNLKNMSLAIFDNDELDEQTIKDTQESIVVLLENDSTPLFSIIKEKEAGIEAMKNLGNYYLEKARKDDVINNYKNLFNKRNCSFSSIILLYNYRIIKTFAKYSFIF